MTPDDPRLGHALYPGGGDIVLAELLDHQAPGHAGDVGERKGAEYRRRQDEMGKGVGEDLPLADKRGVDQQLARNRLDQAIIEDIEATRPGQPVELAVEEKE